MFRDDADRARFLAQLAESKELYSVRLFLVCLMPNHFHLLLGTPGGNLSRCLGRLITAYTVYFNRRYHRVGHLTQGRFAAQLVEGNEYLLKLSRYIHLNPVCGKRWKGVPVERRQKALRSYGWSTYRSYAGLEAEWPYVDYGPLRALVEEGLKRDYATYVETGLAGDDREFMALYRRARLGLGSDDFTERVSQAHQEAVRKAARPEDASLRRSRPWRTVQETLGAVAAVLGIAEENLRERHRGSLARAAAAWALVRYAGLTQRSAAVALGLGTGAAVSHQLARWQEVIAQGQEWETFIGELDRKLRNA
jgi:REP element-mobilizing transposase RayT